MYLYYNYLSQVLVLVMGSMDSNYKYSYLYLSLVWQVQVRKCTCTYFFKYLYFVLSTCKYNLFNSAVGNLEKTGPVQLSRKKCPYESANSLVLIES